MQGERRNIVEQPKKKGVMIPGSARKPGTYPIPPSSTPSSTHGPVAPAPQLPKVVTLMVEKVLNAQDGKLELVELYIEVCKAQGLNRDVAQHFCSMIVGVVGAVLKMTSHFISHGVPLSRSGDEQIQALRKAFAVLPFDHVEPFRMCCDRACKFAKEERAKIREEKEKARMGATKKPASGGAATRKRERHEEGEEKDEKKEEKKEKKEEKKEEKKKTKTDDSLDLQHPPVPSDYERHNFGAIVDGSGKGFYCDLIRLITKADKNGRERIRMGFPHHVACYEAWCEGKVWQKSKSE